MAETRSGKGKQRLALHWQILIGLLLAVAVGIGFGGEASVAGVRLVAVYGFLGDLFLNALKMLIVPLIAASIITGMAGMGDSAAVGRLGVRTLIYYMTTSLAAILTGLVLVNVVRPGIMGGRPAAQVLGLGTLSPELAERVQGRGLGELAGVFLRMIPDNVVAAAGDNRRMLALIVFSLLFGFFMLRIGEPGASTLRAFWQGVLDVMMGITELVMRFAPVGVFGLVAKVMATTGFEAFRPLLGFFLVVAAGLAVHAGVTLPLLLRVVGRVRRPLAHVRAMAPALLMAFSTSSSSATLPLTLECAERRAGIPNRIASFVLPLGATVNMDGTALYECAAAMFLAQAYGLHLGFATQFVVVLMALLTSVGVAGVPSASLVAITIILSAVGLPLEAMGLILVVDRVLDMARTAVNVYSDSCGAAILAAREAGVVEG